AGVTALALLASTARVPWLARAYAVSIAVTLLLRIAALVRLRRSNPQPGTYRTPWNVRIGGWDIPVGLTLVAVVALSGLLSAFVFRNPPTLITAGAILLVGAVFLFGAQSGAATTPL